MNITVMKKLGLTKKTMASVSCQCSSKNLSTAYFVEADEYQITCLDCQRDGSGPTYLAAAYRLSVINNGQAVNDPNCIISKL